MRGYQDQYLVISPRGWGEREMTTMNTGKEEDEDEDEDGMDGEDQRGDILPFIHFSFFFSIDFLFSLFLFLV